MARFMVPSLVLLLCGAVLLAPAAAPAQGSGLTAAQLRQLHQLNMPVVAPVPAPRGFRVTRVVSSAYDRTYKIVYQNRLGATMTFEGSQLYAGAATGAAPGRNAPATAAESQPKPKRGFLQKLFAGGAKPPAVNANAVAGGTSQEAEGQTASGIPADSALVGPVRFTPAGPCLQGTSDATKATLRGLRVVASGCNFDNPETLVSAYKALHRV